MPKIHEHWFSCKHDKIKEILYPLTILLFEILSLFYFILGAKKKSKFLESKFFRYWLWEFLHGTLALHWPPSHHPWQYFRTKLSCGKRFFVRKYETNYYVKSWMESLISLNFLPKIYRSLRNNFLDLLPILYHIRVGFKWLSTILNRLDQSKFFVLNGYSSSYTFLFTSIKFALVTHRI